MLLNTEYPNHKLLKFFQKTIAPIEIGDKKNYIAEPAPPKDPALNRRNHGDSVLWKSLHLIDLFASQLAVQSHARQPKRKVSLINQLS